MGTTVFSDLPTLKELVINGAIRQVMVQYQTESDGQDYEGDVISYRKSVAAHDAMTSHDALERNLFSFRDCPNLTVTIGPGVTSLPMPMINEMLAQPNLTLASRAALRRLAK